MMTRIRSLAHTFSLIAWFHLAVISDCASGCPVGCHCGNEAPFLTSCVDRNFAEIPSDIPDRTEELYLKGNRFRVLPEGAFRDLVNLKRLVFTYNKLETLEPNAFVGLKDLVHLDLRWNNLTSLPSYGFSGLANLKKLDLDFNEIHSIAELAFSDLSLTKLGLENNRKLTEIHSDAFQDSSVLQLFIFGSNLTLHSANAFRTLRNSLQELYWLENQQPLVLPVDLFQGFKFTNLILESNGIKDVRFLKNVSADYLSLVGNPTGPICLNSYHSLRNVRTLHLDHTNFSYIDPSCLQGFNQLENLHLQNNGIRYLSELLEPLFSRLKSLKLDGNLLHCNCELIWLKRWLATGGSKDHVTGAQCATPFEEDIAVANEENMQCTVPRIVNVTKGVEVKEGDKLAFSCFVEGDPPPDVSWHLPDGTVRHNKFQFYQTETASGYKFEKTARTSDAGINRCIAINMLGNDTNSVVVKVLPKSASFPSSSPSSFSLFFHRVALTLLLNSLVPLVVALFS